MALRRFLPLLAILAILLTCQAGTSAAGEEGRALSRSTVSAVSGASRKATIGARVLAEEESEAEEEASAAKADAAEEESDASEAAEAEKSPVKAPKGGKTAKGAKATATEDSDGAEAAATEDGGEVAEAEKVPVKASKGAKAAKGAEAAATEGSDGAEAAATEDNGEAAEAEKVPVKASKGAKAAKGAEAAATEDSGEAASPEAAADAEVSEQNDEKSDDAPDPEPTNRTAAAMTVKPAPLLFAGQDDISAKGNCSRDLRRHCKGLAAGKASLVNCITDHVKTEKAGNDGDAVPVSDGCKAEVRLFKISMYSDVSMDKAMAEACKDDISKNCDDDFLYPEPGNVVACLREVHQVGKLADACQEQVVRAQLDAADDFKKDPQLNQLCSAEAERLCKDVEPGGGRVQDCLRSHRDKLAWDCQAELFRQEVENADDIRLNVRLFQACLNDQRKFCADVKYGDARVKDCLEEHRLDADFSPRCKTEFDKMMERRAADFRLDSSLRKYCKADITGICYPDAEDISDVANWDAKVIQCLQDYSDELKDQKCRNQVHKLTKRAAEDIRFDKPLADACYADRQSLCRDVPDGMAQVFLCLQEHEKELKPVCRSALFDELVRFAEDIDFKFPIKRSCAKELDLFCKDFPEGHAKRMQCLQDKIDDTDMGEDCRKGLTRDLKRTAEDYRLNYRLNKACFTDVSKLCAHACDKELEAGSVTCGGAVLKCLQESADKIETENCKQELFKFDKLMVRDPLELDVPLQRACADNITTLCKDVSKDHARTLACLRRHRRQLSKECRDEEKRFSIMEASDIRLTPSLMNACGQELQGLCKDMSPKGGEAFKCLQQNLEDVRMGAACKGEVNLQELRHASDYRLDVRVRTECVGDVEKFCKDADAGEEGHALVLKCMVQHNADLTSSCQTEVAYAVRMVLWQYQKNASLTEPCDPAVTALCANRKAKEVDGVVIGVYGQCLTAAKRSKLAPECQALVGLVVADGAHVGGSVDQDRLEETLKKIAELQAQAAAGGGEGASEGGLVITGWMALLAVAALVLVLLGVGYFTYQRFFNPTRNYTLVVKGGVPVAGET